jgi:hypothetical protein
MSFFDLKDWGLIAARKTKLRELEKSEQHLNSQIKETRKNWSSSKQVRKPLRNMQGKTTI